MEDINEAIRKEELSFGKSIDSLELQGSPFISLAAAFRTVLNDHLSLSNIRMTLPAGVKRPADKQQELLHALKELQAKDSQISLLERRLREVPGDNKDAVATEGTGTLPGLQAENDVLRQRLTEQQRTETALREQLGKLNGAAGSREAANNTLMVRNSTLERKMTDLVRSPNAEVQEKAKERLAQLKNLAAAAHD